MAKIALRGLTRAHDLYELRGERAKELAKRGRKLIGYFCSYTPVELFTALDLVPYRIQGKVGKPVEKAGQYLESIVCPYVRSCFDIALSGEYDFLSGAVIPHTCDAMHRLYDIWVYYLKPPFSQSLYVPHMTHPASYDFFAKEIEYLLRNLELFVERTASEEDLLQAIKLHNRSRVLLRELYEMRKSSPPLISGTEIIWALVAGMTIPVQEFNELLEETIEEVRSRKPESYSRTRLLISGSEVDDDDLIRVIEESGAAVVMDDLCTGSRSFWQDVDTSKEAVAGLAERYLDIPCPRTYRPGKAAQRFSYLGDFIRDWNVQGVVLYTIRFCDTYQLDAPEMKDYIQSLGLPVLYLEDAYTTTPVGQWKTRVEAFLETIESRRE
ncbi:MAG: 2-hydroxyacyl-CoA dehydratase [Chloroflexi bacterium]|nr:2-hydroxyacyl-CoA dehydratase [Chloroflexota bacterium]